jgi:hypothetical protein
MSLSNLSLQARPVSVIGLSSVVNSVAKMFANTSHSLGLLGHLEATSVASDIS